MAANADGSGGSPSPKSESQVITLDQVQALVEGGLLDAVLAKSPAFIQIHDRLASVETGATQVQQTLGQITEQLGAIVRAIQSPAAGEGTVADPGQPPAAAGNLAAWAPLINALAQSALAPKAAPATPPLQESLATIGDVIKLVIQLRQTFTEADALSFKVMRNILREDGSKVAHLGADKAEGA